MTIIESDVNLEYAHAILMASILVVVIYFRIAERIARFFYGWYQMITLYLQIMLNVMKILRYCLNVSYRCMRAIFFGRTKHSNDGKTLLSKKRKHSN